MATLARLPLTSAAALIFQMGTSRVLGLARVESVSEDLNAQVVGADPWVLAALSPTGSNGSSGLECRPACAQQPMGPSLSCEGLLIPDGLGQGRAGLPHCQGSKSSQCLHPSSPDQPIAYD